MGRPQQEEDPNATPPPPSPPEPAPFPPAQPHFPPAPMPQRAVPFSPGLQHHPGVPYPKPPPQYGVWTTSLFDCLDDPTNAFITFFCPCVTFGQIAEILDKGQTSCTTSAVMYTATFAFVCVPWRLSSTYRTKLRAMYGLIETPATDSLTHWFCDLCAICQEYRELRNRGLEPSIGWYANMLLQAQQQQTSMAPPVKQTMGA